MPQIIFSEDYLPKTGELRNMSMVYDHDGMQLFKEEAVYDTLCKDNMFEYFANSFLIFARREDEHA